MIRTSIEYHNNIQQGDVISNVEYIEYADEVDGEITISKIKFPLVMVLSQDCDLTQDYNSREHNLRSQNKVNLNQDKYLFSVLVVPLYNYEHFVDGSHLENLNQTMQKISKNRTKTDNRFLVSNLNPRFHYLEFEDTVPIVASVIDFKHYFTLCVTQLQSHKKEHYVCTISALFRERISQRFVNYLSRIGLPDLNPKGRTQNTIDS